MAKNITGTLKYLESGQLVTDWGEGNFLALKFTNNDPDKIKTIKVGLDPSQSSGLVPLDEDMNGVFKITNKDTQKFVVESYDEDNKMLQRDEYSLTGLTCNSKTGPTITIDNSDPIEIEESVGSATLDITTTGFDAETMEKAYESSDENVFTVDAESWPSYVTLMPTGSADDTATVTAKIVDKTTHEVLASDSKGVLIIPEHSGDPYFEFQSEDVADGESYANDYCENGKTMHVIAFNHTYESADEVYVKTTPENTPLTITKELINPEFSDDCLITVSGVNNTSEDITIEVGDTYYGSEETLAIFTIKGESGPAIIPDEEFISLGDTAPYTLTFTVENRPEYTTLEAVSQQTGTSFAVDSTNIENGSVIITGTATGNGTLTINLKDENQTIIASALIPISIDLYAGELNLVWDVSTRGTSPYVYDWTETNRQSSTVFTLVDKDLNLIANANPKVSLVQGSTTLIDKGEMEVLPNNHYRPVTTVNQQINTIMTGKSTAQIATYKAVIDIDYNNQHYTFQANYKYVQK